MTEAQILQALSAIPDPVVERDLVSAGRVAAIDTASDRARVTLQIPPEHARGFEALMEPLAAALPGVQVLLTAHRKAPELNSSPAPQKGNPHTPKRPEGHQGDSGVKTVLAISSAKGGVGKSTVAVNLAWALARAGLRVGLLDADVHGPSLPLLTGLKGERAPTVEVEGRTLIQPLVSHGVKVLSIGFLVRDDGPIVWRGPMVQGAISRMVWDAHWTEVGGTLDVLLIDMPPGTGDPQLGLAQDLLPGHPTLGALIVTTPQDLAMEDARKGREMFAKVGIPVHGTVLNMSAFTCPHCGEDTAVFGEAEVETPLADIVGDVPLSLELRQASERGEPGAVEVFDKLADVVRGKLEN